MTATEFFTSGRAADLALAAIMAEAAAIWLWRRRTGRGPRLSDVAPFLVAGAFFALALRFALTGTAWPWIAVALAASGVAHAVDVARRFRR